MVGTNQEMKELLEENAELKQQLAEQLAHHEHEMEQSLAKAQQLREDMRTQHEEYQKKLMQAENGYKVHCLTDILNDRATLCNMMPCCIRALVPNF